MNKIIKVFVNFFKAIYKIIDNIIVIPISKTVYVINKKIKDNGGHIEKFLNKPYMLVYLSLILAVGIFFLIDSKVINLVQTEAEILTDQPVNVSYNKEAYVVEGLPESVDITLIGRKNDLYLAKQLGDHEVILDLTDYEEGTHRVKMTLNKTIDTLNYKLDPGSISVTIKKKISKLVTISSDLLNYEKLNNKLSVKSVSLSKPEVVIKGSSDTLDRVASVKALVDLNDPKLTDKGSHVIENLVLVAYDDKGKVIDNVEIAHGKVSATVELTMYSKEVSVKVLTNGDLISGRAISNILVNGKDNYKVTIYGDQEELDKVNYIPVTIDVSEQGNKERIYNETLTKPSGVRSISEESVQIALQFGEEAQRTIEGIRIGKIGLASGLTANTKVNEETVSVQIKGVESIINSIDASAIEAFVDLTNYGLGSHQVQVQVNIDDSRISYMALKTVTIVINNSK